MKRTGNIKLQRRRRIATVRRCIAALGGMLLILCFFPQNIYAADQEDPAGGLYKGIYENSGADELMDKLDPETRALLSRFGYDKVHDAAEISGDSWLQTLSVLLNEKLAAPLKRFALILCVLIVVRASACMEDQRIGGVSVLIGVLIVAVSLLPIVAELLDRMQQVTESASVFLLGSVPVSSGLMIASGSIKSGASYSMLTLAAGNIIPLALNAVILPAMNILLALGIVSAISTTRLDETAKKIYGFTKWLLVLIVSVFFAVASIQNIIASSMDAVTEKTVKIAASTAIPVVGGIIGDSISAIRGSVELVKSGVGAFGILALIAIFLPILLEIVVWLTMTSISEIVADLLEVKKLSQLLGSMSLVLKMLLAVLSSIAVVCLVCASVVVYSGR